MTATRNSDPCIDGGTTHAFTATGLDIVADVLSSTRRCTWCGREEHKAYGAGGRRGWRTRDRVRA